MRLTPLEEKKGSSLREIWVQTGTTTMKYVGLALEIIHGAVYKKRVFHYLSMVERWLYFAITSETQT